MAIEGSIRVSSISKRSVTIENLTGNEADQLEGIVNGTHWVKCEEGRLISKSVFEDLPSPMEDPIIGPHWEKEPDGKAKYAIHGVSGGSASEADYYSASFIIQNLCGHYYTEAGYIQAATRLTDYGFICLRSQRTLDGRYHEIWFLPDLLSARGDLKRVVELAEQRWKSESRRVKAIRRFLCRNVSFGTLDMTCERAAAASPGDDDD